MADSVIARAGDTLDGLIWRERGLGIADAPTVLAANPGLAGLGATLPAGTPVIIPTIVAPAVAVREIVQLWS
ncbi:tail protein X [Sphingomonas melonis]|uniref:tail protein X n=1 Tax=Sphingomonas melonis TaxID=152682 RepID=UPI00036B190C|nr:tail protein X [Sphingomonas melonis]